jgi:protein phosphatase
MEFEIWAQTDVGLRREINQDSILIDHDLGLFIVADGMGGHRGGEVASALAIETVQKVIRAELNMKGKKISPRELFGYSYREASSRIHHKSTHESPELMGMGTTMVGLFAYGKKIYIANVGDSRAYLYRNPYLWQLTEDHSLVNEQVRAGVIGEDDADRVQGRNVITRSVGFEREVTVDILEREFQLGDSFLLCSDGLSGLVTNAKILELCNSSTPEELVPNCIKAAEAAGGDDNVSVIFARPRPGT